MIIFMMMFLRWPVLITTENHGFSDDFVNPLEAKLETIISKAQLFIKFGTGISLFDRIQFSVHIFLKHCGVGLRLEFEIFIYLKNLECFVGFSFRVCHNF